MNKTKTIKCALCGIEKKIPLSEYNRQSRKGRINWFCSQQHSAVYNNKTRKNKPIKKVCPHCGCQFDTHTGKNEKTFCSRSCASAGSVSDKRRKGAQKGGRNAPHTVKGLANVLRKREYKKYSKLAAELSEMGVEYKFEQVFDDRVFDLFLPAYNAVIEFDGPDHTLPKQLLIDEEKDKIIKNKQLKIYRIPCNANEVLGISKIQDILKQ